MFSKDQVAFSLLLSGLTADERLSAGAKDVLRKEQVDLASEVQVLTTQAERYAVVIELQSYQKAHKSLTEYLVLVVQSTDTVGVDEFTRKFSEYFKAKESLIFQIMCAIRDILDKHEAVISGIKPAIAPIDPTAELKRLNKYVTESIQATNRDLTIKLGGIFKNLDGLTGSIDEQFANMVQRYEHDIYELGEELRDKVASIRVSNTTIVEADLSGVYTKEEVAKLFSALKFEEFRDSLFDADGYFTGAIRPVSVETTSVSVGADSTDFTLTTKFKPNYLANANHIYWDAGVLTHFKYNNVNTFRWNITSGNRTNLVAGKLYYIYARCNKAGNDGTIVLDTAQRTVNSDPQYYFFKIGTLSSVILGIRGITLSYGRTEINGREITTGRVSSANGLTYFDLDEGEIAGMIKFIPAGGGAIRLVSAVDTVANLALANSTEAKNFIDNILPGELADLQNQIDGNITSWFYGYVPSLTVEPALSWNTTVLKDSHLGDLFYDTVSGKAYRFLFSGGVYSWQMLSDTDITLALSRAASAQDTADGKRRVFVVQPITPYDVGDLWAQGASGDLMRCSVARLSGAYTAGDWVKASKYTDDGVANQAITDAYNALQAASGAQTTANTANNNHASLIASLKALAYVDVVEVAKLGTTIIVGGMLKNTLVDADYIRASIINAVYIQTLELVANKMTTGRLQSVNGFNYFDLTNNQFKVGDANSYMDWNVTTPGQLTIKGHITATSGSIAGVTINATDLFSLNGSKVEIFPNAGMRVFGSGYADFTNAVLKVPTVAATGLAAGEAGFWIGSLSGITSVGGGGGVSLLSELLDVAIGAQTNGQALIWNSTTSKWQPGTVSAGSVDLSGYYTKAESDGKYFLKTGGILDTAGTHLIFQVSGVQKWSQGASAYGDFNIIGSTALGTFGIFPNGVEAFSVNTTRVQASVPINGTSANLSGTLRVGMGSSLARGTLEAGHTLYVGTTSALHGFINSDDGMYFNTNAKNTPGSAFFVWGAYRPLSTGGQIWMQLNGTLAGSGTRMVVADANGNLTTQAIPSSSSGSDTLATVTSRGATTTGNITVNGSVTMLAGNWLYTAGKAGIYNNTYSGHFYQSDSNYWQITGGNVSPMGLKFSLTHEGPALGYVYADGSNFGLLYGGSWAVQTYSGGGTLAGNWSVGNLVINNTLSSTGNLLQTAVNNIYLRPSSGYMVNIDTGNGLYVTNPIKTDNYFYTPYGIYNPNHNLYFGQPVSVHGWYIKSAAASCRIEMRAGDDTIRGFLYADNGNNIGFLHNGGSWAVQAWSTGGRLSGAWSIDGAPADNNYGNLTVNCTTTHGGIIVNSASGYQGHLRFYNASVAQYQIAVDTSGAMRFYSWPAGGFVVNFMPNGNVGIGVEAIHKLHIVESAEGSWAVRMTAGSSGSGVYIGHGSGYGMHINAGTNATASTYALNIAGAGSTIFHLSGTGVAIFGGNGVEISAGYAFQVHGNIRCNSYTYASGVGYFAGDVIAFYSDARLKEKIEPIQNALQKVNSLRGVTYIANDLALSLGAAKDKRQQVGVIAQDFQSIMPEVLERAPFDMLNAGTNDSKSGENYMTVKYERIVPLLIQAIKELSEEFTQYKTTHP